MSFVMTATPLAMHDMMGHSLGETKFVIQSHIVAMFLPSLFTGEIIRKFDELKVIFVGLLAYLGTTSFAYSGVEVFSLLVGVGSLRCGLEFPFYWRHLIADQGIPTVLRNFEFKQRMI